MRLEPIQRNTTSSASDQNLPAPIGGLDESTSITATKPANALRLINFISQKDGLHVRKGTRTWGKVPGSVEAMLGWAGQKQFACTKTGIFEVQRNIITPQLSGHTTGRWLGDMVANPDVQLLVVANGFDGVRMFNGSSWRDTTGTITSDTQPVVRPERLACPIWHQRRMTFYERGTLRVWYLRPGLAGGIASPIEVGPYCQRGGEIVAIASLQPSNALSTDNRLIVYTSNGEVVVYDYTNPDQAVKYGGTYQIALPVGWRPFGLIGGKLAALTTNGLYALPDVVAKPESAQEITALTEPIYKSYDAEANYTLSPNWQVIETVAERGLVIINRPEGDQFGSSFGSWTYLQGMKATAWGETLNGVFFGDSDGTIRQYGAGSDDDPNGTSIYALCVGGYSNLGSPRLKRLARARPNLKSVPVDYSLRALSDYEEPDMTYPAPAAMTPGLGWDFPMDGTGPWNTPKERTQWGWRNVSGRGHALSIAFSVNTRAPLVYRGCDLLLAPGGQT
jgi:hypothetical protein